LIGAAQKKPSKPSLFQVLLLDNSQGQDVEVQEAEQVDFGVVKEHLKNGGSVFITSKDAQKIVYPKDRAQTNYSRSRRTLGAIFHQRLRS
jgi:formylmethanofuran dehydrogenase subunit C